MINPNGFFTINDEKIEKLDGLWSIPSGWWSRGYEYPWALSWTNEHDVVADMGCGYTFRPLKDALARRCRYVYGVDISEKLIELPNPYENLSYIISPMDDTPIPDNFLDKVFCISVLEEVSRRTALRSLKEFRRILKPGGLLIITFDVPYDTTKPSHPLYKGISLKTWQKMIKKAKLCLYGQAEQHQNRDELIHNTEFNLCVYHTVMTNYG